MENKNLERSLIEVIGNSGFFDILSDAGEIILDDSLGEGLLKDVPVIGTIAKPYETGHSRFGIRWNKGSFLSPGQDRHLWFISFH